MYLQETQLHEFSMMEGALIAPRSLPDKPAKGSLPKRLYAWGNAVLIGSVVALLATVMIAYTHHHLFAMSTQIVAHIGMMISAGTLKLGYVLRLTGLRAQRFHSN